MGANKQVKQAKKQVRELELLVAGAAAGAEQRLAALDEMLERSTASTEQTLAAIRGAVDEAEKRVGALDEVLQRSAEDTERALAVLSNAVDESERHRSLAERAAEAASTTVVDLETRSQAHAAAVDRQADAALACVEASGIAAEARATAETDALIAEFSRETQRRIRGIEETTAEALRHLDERMRKITEQGEARLDDLDREVTSRLAEPAIDDGRPEFDTTEPDTTWFDTTEPEITEPDTTWFDTTEPDTTEPDTTWFAPMAGTTLDDATSLPLSVSLDDVGAATTPVTDPVDPVYYEIGAWVEEPSPTATDAKELPSTVAPVSATTTIIDARPRSGAPVVFTAGAAQVHASLEQLRRTAADGWVNVELAHSAADGQAVSALRFTVFDLSGFWEYHDVAGQASAFSRAKVTADISELSHAIEVERHIDAHDRVSITLDDDITIGSVLVLSRTPQLPQLGGERRKIERVDLSPADRTGLVLDSQIGRFVVPSRIVSLLRSRRAHDADLVTIDDRPCLCARVAGPTPETTATIVVPLDQDGDAPVATDERRGEAPSPIVQLLGALSSTSTPEELSEIIASGVGYARRRAAAHPSLPPGLIDAILRDGTDAMRAAAASNPSITRESIDRAATDAAPAVRAAVATNPDVPPAVLLRLANDDASEVRLRVATNPELPVELLEHLTEDPNPAVRAIVAGDHRTPVETLVAMSHDASPIVCAAVAQNPSCPIRLLDELLAVVPEVVLSNPHTPEHLLVAGSQVRARHLRVAVAANPATPVRQLQQLARDPDPEVRAAVADNHGAPPKARRRARRPGSRSASPSHLAADAAEVTSEPELVAPLT